MSQAPNPFGAPQSFPLEYGREGNAVSVAQFFNGVYAWMAAGLAVTAAVGWWVSSQMAILRMISGPAILVLFVLEFALVMIISGATRRIGPTAATALFILYSALNGVTLSFIFLIYAHAVIASAFIVTAGMFGAMSLYGFVTRRDLTAFGAFLFMGLVGLIIASVVSIFWHPTILTVLINYIGVFIFVGLTAYHTQRLKYIALQTQNDAMLSARFSIIGALTLYLNFLNLFLLLLRIFSGNDRR